VQEMSVASKDSLQAELSFKQGGETMIMISNG